MMQADSSQERGDLFGKVGSAVHHRQQDTVYLELGVDLPLYLVYRGAQGKILNFILVESTLHPVYQKDIEREFSLRPSTVTEMLKSLESRDLIVRIPDENDGRFKRIAFTEKAAAVKDALNQEIHETEALLLRGISEQELMEFTQITEKMLQNLDSEEKSSSPQ